MPNPKQSSEVAGIYTNPDLNLNPNPKPNADPNPNHNPIKP